MPLPNRVRSPWRAGLLVLLLALLAVGAWFGWETVVAWRPLAVEVWQIPHMTSRTAEPTALTAGGYIIPRRKIQLSSKVTGRVAAVTVEKGDPVRQGQVLVQLEEAEFRAQVEEARGNVRMAQARLAELEAGSRPQEVEQAQATVALAEANWRNAQLNHDRAQQLLARGLLAQGEYDKARMTYEVTQAQVTEAKKRAELVAIGPRREQIALARAQVAAARAALARAETWLAATAITAPTEGTVLERLVEVGEMVTTSFVGERGAKSSVVSLANLRDLQVELDISQADFNKLTMGQKVLVVPEAYTERTYDGRLVEMAPEANRQKATVQVKVHILNPDAFLRPEMNAKVTFLQAGSAALDDATRAPAAPPRLVIPRTAVRHHDGTTTVLLVQEGKAVLRPVTLGRDTPQGVEVLAGLTGGDVLIVTAVHTMQPGRLVTRK